MTDQRKFRFSIDRGGTFTDIYAEVPGDPGFRVVKLLSEDPHNYADAPREGIRRILQEVTGQSLPAEGFDASRIEWIRMGTTVATNALLERKGVRCALVVTRGFADILRIGNQNRADIFDLKIQKPELLYECVVETEERLRILKDGNPGSGGKVVTGITGDRLEILTPLDAQALRPRLERVFAQGIRSLAVALLHAYAWPDHELAIGRLAEQIGFTQISLSCRVMPRVKLVARGDTTMVDAYLNPHIRDYLTSFRKGFSDGLAQSSLLFMQSDGGLASADGFTGSRAILSGPAGGVVGYAMTTYQQETGQPVIGFDMGGTSTDVSRFGGRYELVFETETAGVRIQAPQLHIKTVAAGGGSRLFFENGMFMVGPQSAGAHPGPVCYRKGGQLAVTDANLVLGRIQPQYFPHIFGAAEDQPLDRAASHAALTRLAERINAQYAARGLPPLTVEQVALGFIQVANESMVRPIREISVLRGFDSKEHILATFGGAGPQHACAIARSLGIREIFVHRFAGILSAYGMGLADVVVERQKPSALVYGPQALPAVKKEIAGLTREAFEALARQGFERRDMEATPFLNLRYEGTDTAMMIAAPADDDYARQLSDIYLREFGFDLAGRAIKVDDIRVRARGITANLRRLAIEPAGECPPQPLETVPCYFEQGWQDTLVYDLEQLKAGHTLSGPAIIIHDTSTILVEADCRAQITAGGDVRIQVGANNAKPVDTRVDPIQLSIFSNLFISIAEQMGRMLQKTAISTNIKERLDFSCALFGPSGDLVANAPHIPVHLGAMSEAVKAQISRWQGRLAPGDVLVSNHPIAGGSHLPDITVITPVFRHGSIIFWVAARGHHADIGGISPGSMPPTSRRIEEEGACIVSFKLVENGIFQENGISDLLRAPGRIPPVPGRPPIAGTRQLADNISDLKAQVAANQKGIELLLEMVEHYGLEVVQAYMGHVQDAAEEAVRSRLRELSLRKGLAEKDTVCAVDHLDDGSPICLALTIDRFSGTAVFDFSGTGSEIWGNCNAPRAVTMSAILYCLRCLVEKDLPLNNGCLIPIAIRIPDGSLLSPSPEAAVVGGNVLTSQRVVDVVLKAFGVAAASQGCMNNLTFGNERFGYYETIGGGAGAGPDWNGQSGVHTHMTNTRITDPEILERRFPVLLREFSIREGSGGRGAHNGGNGLIREIEFLEPLNVAILSERRVFAPYGLEGGRPGRRGENLFIRQDGRRMNLGAKNEIQAQAGDRIRIETPGGGGFGTPPAGAQMQKRPFED
jgi:5-oxoprolinase (ATP-hydrolysing)